MAKAAPKKIAPRASWKRSVLAWGLALAAVAFVVHVVPLRDRCEEPGAALIDGKVPKVPVTRDAAGCTLHGVAGEAHLAPLACAALKCEPGLESTFANVRFAELAPLLALYFLGMFAWAARWRALLALAGVKLGLLETWRVTLEAQAGGILLPGGIGGDALRVGFVVAKGGPLATVIAAVMLDRFLGLAALAGLAAAFAFALGGGELGAMAISLAAIPVALALGLVVLRARPVAALVLRTRLARVARPLFEYLGDPRAPRAILHGALLALVVAGTQLGVVRGLVSALGAVPSAQRWVFMGTTMSFIVSAIPALPGALGTGDAAFVFFFEKAGLAASAALAVSLLYRLFWYSSGGVGAVLYLLRSHRRSTPPSPRSALEASSDGGERKT